MCVTDAGAVHAHITTAPVGVSPSIPGYLGARRLSPQFLRILCSRVRESANERERTKGRKGNYAEQVFPHRFQLFWICCRGHDSEQLFPIHVTAARPSLATYLPETIGIIIILYIYI